MILQHRRAWKAYKLGKWLPFKGGEKVRPYLEVKVVKVVKEKNCDAEFICPVCNKVLHHKGKVEPKGNWVNGENLDKIKFPCFCSHFKNQYGIITKTYLGEDKETIYTLHNIEMQYMSLSSIKSYTELRKLIKAFDIHILKGKIILFEDDDTNEKYDIDIEEE